MTDPIKPATDEQLQAWKDLAAKGSILLPVTILDRSARDAEIERLSAKEGR